MPDPLTWSVDLTPEEASVLTSVLEAILVRQNRRLRERIQAVRDRLTPPHALQVLRWVGVVLSFLGLLLALWLWRCAPRRPFAPVAAGTITVFLVIFLSVPRVEAWMRELGPRIARRNARRLGERIRRRGAVHIDYALGEGWISSTTQGVASHTSFSQARFVVLAERFGCLFRARKSQMPARLVYFAEPADRERLAAALSAAGVEVERFETNEK